MPLNASGVPLMTVTAASKSSNRLRRYVYAPALAIFAAGTLVSGAGIGAASEAIDAGSGSTDIASENGRRVHNLTDQTLTAQDFHRDQGEEYRSALAFGGATQRPALRPGDHAGAYQPSAPVTNAIKTGGNLLLGPDLEYAADAN